MGAGAPMVLMVGPNAGEVERALRAGELVCPGCEGRLRPWGFASPRTVQLVDGPARQRPRRGRCRRGGGTHVLLPDVMLVRRAHGVEVIGAALHASAGGAGWRRVAAMLGVAATTVRGWVRRWAERAERLRAHFTRLAVWLDATLAPIGPRASPSADALEAVAAAAVAAGRRWSAMPLWRFAAAASGGRLLCNTGSPFPAPWTAGSVPARDCHHELGGWNGRRAPP